MEGVALLVSIAGALVTVVVSITVLITFKRSSREAAVQQGKREQAQADSITRLDTKVDNMKTELSQKIEGVQDSVSELKGEVKNLSAQMGELHTGMTVIATQHEINHPGQKIKFRRQPNVGTLE